jgi:hypothetical protein
LTAAATKQIKTPVDKDSIGYCPPVKNLDRFVSKPEGSPTVCFRDLAKSANGGSILSSSQFLILPLLPQKIKLASKVVKVDSKIIISLPKI